MPWIIVGTGFVGLLAGAYLALPTGCWVATHGQETVEMTCRSTAFGWYWRTGLLTGSVLGAAAGVGLGALLRRAVIVRAPGSRQLVGVLRAVLAVLVAAGVLLVVAGVPLGLLPGRL